MVYPNDKAAFYHHAQELLHALKLYVKAAEIAKMTDEQFFIDFEDSINELSVKDHNIC